MAILLSVMIACATKEEKGRILIISEVKEKLSYPDSFKLMSLDTLDCYEDTKNCVFRVTFSHKTESAANSTDLSFIVIGDDLSIIAASDDFREIGDHVKLSTFHEYAKKIDFGSRHLLGDFDIVSVEELKKIDLESRGITN